MADIKQASNKNNSGSAAPHAVSLNPSSKRFLDYLRSYYAKKEDKLPSTHSRIKNEKMGISGGTYHVPDEKIEEFMKTYYREIVSKNEPEYITETQLESGGAIAIDVDFRHQYSITTRQYTKDHIIDLICLYLDELKKMFQFDSEVHIPVFVFEKKEVNRVQDKDQTKDGIHIIIGIQADRTVQILLRNRIISKIEDIWNKEELQVTNSWEDVFDKGISVGCTNWQLYGSRKPGYEAYTLTIVYNVHIDPQDGELMMPEVVPSIYMNEERFLELSIKYKKHPALFMTTQFIEEYQSTRGGSNSNSSSSSSSSSSSTSRTYGVPTQILQIRTKEELESAVQYFLESLEPDEFELREAFQYIMVLPKMYYELGSFTKWMRIGWALCNISDKLFIAWVAFSSQSEHFSYTSIRDDMWDRWQKFDTHTEGGLTKRSIMYWARQENPTMYNQIRLNSVEFYIEQTLARINIANLNNDSKGAVKGSGDYDVATVLYQLFKEEYVCVSVKSNIWYRFKSHKWAEIDSGTTLRKSISEELRAIYTSKAGKMARQLTTLDPESDKSKMLKRRIEIIGSIIDRLSRTNDKKNIMTEAKDIFFDSQFFDKMDTNPNIICFKNGVYDFKEPIGFRNGRPEDYISKCTNTNYVELNHTNLQIQEEINDFMCKLFPDPQLRKYMWEHLASTLLGTTPNQTFNTYIGVGRNGKSVLMKLMSLTLGEYKGDVPLTLLTQQRAKVGGLSPELVQLKGVRYAVIQEPSKGEKMNEGIMKQLTGGDPVQCRSPYMLKTLTFIPQFKLVVCTNNLMEVKSQDGGTWRRIRVVEFESLFTEEPVSDDVDKPFQFKIVNQDIMDEKCDYWKEVFASQLVQIAKRTMGKVENCSRVTSASNSYRDGQDIMTEFIRDRTEKCTNGCISKSCITNELRDWYFSNYSCKPPHSKEFIPYMDTEYGKMKGGAWIGCRLKPTQIIPNNLYHHNNDIGSDITESDEEEGSMNYANIEDLN